MHFVVTAGNRGLGLEFVKQLLERGERVTTTARDPSEAGELRQLDDKYGELNVHELDVTDPETVESFAARLGEDHVDVLINNAGRLSRGGSPDDFDFDDIEGDFRVNAVGTLRVTEACMPALRRAEGAKIVNISSKMGSIADNGSGGSYAYRMSKAALNMATRSLANDLAAEGMIATVLHPGWVKTRMGGSNALISPEKSIRNMLEIIDDLGPKNNGHFYEWSGEEVPW